jgi:hypothetical protein
MMDFVSFHALLMRLMLLDEHELVETGALPANDPAAWAVFRSDPARWFITADPAKALAAWIAINRRVALEVKLRKPEGNVVKFKSRRTSDGRS